MIFRETTGTQNFSFSKDSADTKLSQNEEKSRAEKGYDCVICSSELHPVDNITLLNTIKQGTYVCMYLLCYITGGFLTLGGVPKK